MNANHRIMIVEDSATQAMRLQLELAKHGWETTCAVDADQALARLEAENPDLMIVDFNLPGMSGAELCRRIRMNINTRGIPIVMLTADDQEGIEVRGLDSGADDFFKKSSDTEILVVRIRAMLERSGHMESILHRSESYFKRARILAIDDSTTYLVHLQSLLGSEGYQVEAVNNGHDGLKRLELESFDCVLVDLVMPDLDGIEVCRRITSMRDRLDNPIAVLMLTGREGREDLTRALEAGADDFVGKSSDVAVLKGRIRALLRRKFFQEENQRIVEELKNKELEAVRARAEKESFEAKIAQQRQREAEAATTEVRRAKGELERINGELLRSNDELRQFAHVASHDLQEPLRSITSFCNLLKENYHDRIDAEANDFIDRIVSGATRMKTLVRDLLSYSRVTREEQVPFESVDCNQVVHDAVENLQLAIDETGAEVSSGDLPTVVGDRSQLIQLLQNLIANAIRYRSEDPPRIVIDARDEDGNWEFAVRDNGIGVAAKYHEQIFEIFKRLHGRSTYPGTGIGLAVCRKIVQRHGGRIWIESSPGQGSVFRFTIAGPKEDLNHDISECYALSHSIS